MEGTIDTLWDTWPRENWVSAQGGVHLGRLPGVGAPGTVTGHSGRWESQEHLAQDGGICAARKGTVHEVWGPVVCSGQGNARSDVKAGT